jgi:hypothetical protein
MCGPNSKRHPEAARATCPWRAPYDVAAAAWSAVAVAAPEVALEGALLFAPVDLDGDGVDDVVITLQHPTQCGNDGCMGLALNKVADGYVIATGVEVSDREGLVARVGTGTSEIVVPLQEVIGMDRAYVLAPEFPADRADAWRGIAAWLRAGIAPELPPFVLAGQADVDGDGTEDWIVALPLAAASEGVAYVLTSALGGLREAGRAPATFERYAMVTRTPQNRMGANAP